MRTPQQGTGTAGADGSTRPQRGRRRQPVPHTEAERAAALALWGRALALGAGSGVAGQGGLPPVPMLDMLTKACRGRLQAHLWLPRRLDDAYLVRIVAMMERRLLREAAERTAQAGEPIPPKD